MQQADQLSKAVWDQVDNGKVNLDSIKKIVESSLDSYVKMYKSSPTEKNRKNLILFDQIHSNLLFTVPEDKLNIIDNGIVRYWLYNATKEPYFIFNDEREAFNSLSEFVWVEQDINFNKDGNDLLIPSEWDIIYAVDVRNAWTGNIPNITLSYGSGSNSSKFVHNIETYWVYWTELTRLKDLWGVFTGGTTFLFIAPEKNKDEIYITLDGLKKYAIPLSNLYKSKYGAATNNNLIMWGKWVDLCKRIFKSSISTEVANQSLCLAAENWNIFEGMDSLYFYYYQLKHKFPYRLAIERDDLWDYYIMKWDWYQKSLWITDGKISNMETIYFD